MLSREPILLVLLPRTSGLNPAVPTSLQPFTFRNAWILQGVQTSSMFWDSALPADAQLWREYSTLADFQTRPIEQDLTTGILTVQAAAQASHENRNRHVVHIRRLHRFRCFMQQCSSRN